MDRIRSLSDGFTSPSIEMQHTSFTLTATETTLDDATKLPDASLPRGRVELIFNRRRGQRRGAQRHILYYRRRKPDVRLLRRQSRGDAAHRRLGQGRRLVPQRVRDDGQLQRQPLGGDVGLAQS